MEKGNSKSTTIEDVKNVLTKALVEAGKIQREHFLKDHNIEIKESISSIVTEVDFLCDKVITEIIISSFPEHNVLTEESGFRDHGSEYTWVVDPLDGTSNFASGISWFGILIAVFKNSRPFMAGAYLPIDNLLYFAESGKGAFLNGQRLKLGDMSLRNSLVAFGTDYTTDSNFQEFGINMFRWLITNTRNVRSTNSLVDWMLAAEGKMGAVVNMFTKIWDIAAPWLIIREAGGAFEHLTEPELTFTISNDTLATNYAVVAGTSGNVAEIKRVSSSLLNS